MTWDRLILGSSEISWSYTHNTARCSTFPRWVIAVVNASKKWDFTGRLLVGGVFCREDGPVQAAVVPKGLLTYAWLGSAYSG